MKMKVEGGGIKRGRGGERGLVEWMKTDFDNPPHCALKRGREDNGLLARTFFLASSLLICRHNNIMNKEGSCHVPSHSHSPFHFQFINSPLTSN
jgi:hypothetical protein